MEQKKCKDSLIYLVSEVLGSDNPQKNLWGSVHIEIAKHLKDLERECLILIPRGHLKSTLVTQGWSLQQLIKDPTLRILIASADQEKAKGFLASIRDNIERNEKFKRRFGDLRSENGTWSNFCIDIKGKTSGSKEHSVAVASVGMDMTSQHYDIIILDDLVNRKLSTSEDQRAKVEGFYMDCLDLLEPTGKMILIGTRWHFGDLYSKLLKEYEKNSSKFDFVFNRPALTNPKYTRKQFKEMLDDKDTKALFPSKMSIKYLKHLYGQKKTKAGGIMEFACQQMNYPMSDPRNSFKREDVEFVKELPGSITWYMCVDPAGSDSVKKDSDDTAIALVGMDINGDIYNIDMYAEAISAAEVPAKIYEWFEKYPQVRKVGIEKDFNAANATLIRDRYPKMRRKLFEYKSRHVLDWKKKKMLALSPYVANGKFKMLEHDDGLDCDVGDGRTAKLHLGQVKLLDQMSDFGSTPHDDALDAQSSALEFLKRSVVYNAVETEYEPEDPYTGY